jgi:N-glycosylase/DNA lyase
MNNEINERARYYLEIGNSEQKYYLVKTALENIDEFTTYFDNQFSLIEFLKKRYQNLNNLSFDSVEIAYQLKGKIKTEDIIYKNFKVILNSQKLASIITNYLLFLYLYVSM